MLSVILALHPEAVAVAQVDEYIRLLTKRARFDGQLFIDEIADTGEPPRSCSDVAAGASVFLNSRGDLVHFSQISHADIAAMSSQEYQRFADAVHLFSGDSTAFLPEKGALARGTNSAGQFISGSHTSTTENRF